MTKRKRTRKARNKIEGSSQGALIKVDPSPLLESSVAVHRSRAVTVARSSIFTAEFEEVIELIARERVYRAMLAGLGRRLLITPMTNIDTS